ncbi:MAG: four helix bundle protein [Bacteroidetes bacterium]|nr:four helix bundle protein [Bacteroidota bacterium]
MDNEMERPTTFFRFEDLRIYHKALEYVDSIYAMARSAKDDYYTRSFFERFLAAATSIATNIAEGSSRNKSQFVYYLKMAKSSVRECVVLSTMAQSQKFITADGFEGSKNHLMEMTKMIGALIGSLQRSVRPGELGSDDEEGDG